MRRDAEKKGTSPTQRTLDACRLTFLLTSVSASEADDATIAILYRLRWQAELTFTRSKSLLALAGPRADDPGLT